MSCFFSSFVGYTTWLKGKGLNHEFRSSEEIHQTCLFRRLSKQQHRFPPHVCRGAPDDEIFAVPLNREFFGRSTGGNANSRCSFPALLISLVKYVSCNSDRLINAKREDLETNHNTAYLIEYYHN